jgi:hypothetical protein
VIRIAMIGAASTAATISPAVATAPASSARAAPIACAASGATAVSRPWLVISSVA